MNQSLDHLLRLIGAAPLHWFVFIPLMLILLVLAGRQFSSRPIDHKRNVYWLIAILFFLAIWATLFWPSN